MGGPFFGVCMNFIFSYKFFFFSVCVFPFLVFFHLFPVQNFIEYWFLTFALGVMFLGFLGGGQFGCSNAAFVVAFLFLSLLVLASIGGGSASFSLAMFFVFGLFLFLASSLSFLYSEKVGWVRYFRGLAVFLCAGAALQGVAALLLYLGVMHYFLSELLPAPSARMLGFIAQSNLLAVYMFAGLVSVIYISLVDKAPRPSSVLLLAAMFFSFILAGSGSRAAILNLFLCIGSFFLLRYKLRVSWGWVFLWCFSIVGGFASFYLLGDILLEIFLGWGFLAERYSVVEVMRSGSMDFRLGEIYKSWVMIDGKEIFGVGFGNYGRVSQALLVSGYGESINSFPYHSHNFFAQVLAEFGLSGILVLFVSCGALLWLADFKGRFLEVYFISLVSWAFLVNSMIEYVLWYMHFSVLLVVCVSPFFGGSIKVVAFRSRLLVGFTFSFLVFLGSFYAWSAYLICLRSIKGYGAEEAIVELRRAGEGWWFGNEIKLLQTHHFRPSSSDLAYQDHVTGILMEWRPYDHVMFRRMHVLILQGDRESAVKLAGEFRVAYPLRVEQAKKFFSGDGFDSYVVAGAVVKALD